MLLQKQSTLEELLVALLAVRPNLTVKQLAAGLRERGHDYTDRGIYKELGKLETQEIVVKTQQTFSLRLAWLTNVLSFADGAYEKYTSADYLSVLITSTKGKLLHRFTNLRKLDLYWIQAMMALHRLYPERAMCLWIPHQWFHLIHDYAIRQFYGALDITGGRRYHIFGMDCYLSRLGQSYLPKHGHYSFSESPFRGQMNVYYSLIGNHLITVRLDQSIVKKINDLFLQISSAKEMDQQVVAEVLSSRVKASLCIEENEAKVRRLRGQFESFFGASIE